MYPLSSPEHDIAKRKTVFLSTPYNFTSYSFLYLTSSIWILSLIHISYIVEENIDGETLAEYLQINGKFSEKEVIFIIKEMCIRDRLGACIISLVKKEFRPRGGSAPVTRFTLGAFVMIGCLMFLGCPFRMILRLAGGDGNALFGLDVYKRQMQAIIL